MPRPHHHAWLRQLIQNSVVMSGLVFGHRLGEPGAVALALAAFGLLGLLSWVSLILEPAIDGRRAGRAWRAAALAIAAAALGLAFVLDAGFGGLLTAFLALRAAGSQYFRRMVLMDVIGRATEFALKAAAGAQVLSVTISPWLLLTAFLLALVVVIGRRRNALHRLPEREPGHEAPPPPPSGYSLRLLDQMLAVVTSSVLIAYTLYTISPRTVGELGSNRLMFTVPIVLYGILRYLYLVHRGDLEAGCETMILRDRPLAASIGLWLLVALRVLYV